MGVPFALLLALGSVAACGGAEPPPQNPVSAEEKEEQRKFEEGKRKLNLANEAFASKKYAEARQLLEETKKLNVEALAFDISTLEDKIDKKVAKLWANESEDGFKAGECGKTFDDLAKKIKELGSEAFTRELRAEIGTMAVKCVEGVVNERVSAEKYADARKLVEGESIVVVLGDTATNKLKKDVDGFIVAGLATALLPDIKAQKWADARKKLDDALARGDATETHVQELQKPIRDGIAKEVVSLADAGIGSTRAPALLKQIDGLLEIARWRVMATSEGAELSANAMPAEVEQKRFMLATWVQAQKLRIKPLKRPEVRFAHGKIAVTPGDNADGASKRDIVHGGKIWVLGFAGNRALISVDEPSSGTLVAMLEKAIGWVPSARLASADTQDWVLPDDQLVGTRVWSQLRLPEKEVELGTVTEVLGADVNVKREADAAIIKVPKKSLRSGRLAAGTKVLTFCTEKGQKAEIVEITPDGRTAKLKCEGGQLKEEVLASLRSTYELLPAAE